MEIFDRVGVGASQQRFGTALQQRKKPQAQLLAQLVHSLASEGSNMSSTKKGSVM